MLPRLGIALALVLVSAGMAPAQSSNASPHEPATPQPPSSFSEVVQVVAVAPIHGLGIAASKVPSPVQSFGAEEIARLGSLQ